MNHLSSAPETGIVLDYLIACWNRLETLKQPSSPILLRELRFIVISYMGLILTIPSLFPQPVSVQEAGPAILIPRLQENLRLTRELIDRYAVEEAVHEQESKKTPGDIESRPTDPSIAPSPLSMLQEIFEPILVELSQACAREGILGRELLPTLDTIQTLLQLHPAMLNVLLRSSLWRGPYTAPMICHTTLLGGLLGLGVDPRCTKPLGELLPHMAAAVEGNGLEEEDPSASVSNAQVASAMYALRTALELLVGRVHGLLLFIIKSSAMAKEAVLSWWAWLASINGERLKIHVREETVSDDRLLANMFMVLLRFCGPFLRAPEKLALIDPTYYWQVNGRIDVMEATKNNATAAEYTEFLAKYRECPLMEEGRPVTGTAHSIPLFTLSLPPD